MIKRLARWVLRGEIDSLKYFAETLQRQRNELDARVMYLTNSLAGVTAHRDLLTKRLEDIGTKSAWDVQQEMDRKKVANGLVVQMFCADCHAGVGDQNDIADGDVVQCFKCGGVNFVHSWDIAL